MRESENNITLTGVISAAVEEERERAVKESAAQLERSVSWVVNKIMDLGWGKYFQKYPLTQPKQKAA